MIFFVTLPVLVVNRTRRIERVKIYFRISLDKMIKWFLRILSTTKCLNDIHGKTKNHIRKYINIKIS